MNYLNFESKIAVLEDQIKQLEASRNKLVGIDMEKELSSMQSKYNKLLKSTYASLTPWQKVMVARHPDRPHALDYIKGMVEDFTYLAGDRFYSEDKALVGGIGRIGGYSFMVIGIEKGGDLETRIEHNFGMPKPEGYRKADRLMQIADRLGLPVLSLVDTSGAYPGKEAEQRGQGEAIAQSTATGLRISTPFINVIIGEGGSGGAIAIASGDKTLMLEHAIYSVISPEGCASILWRDGTMAEKAAENLTITAQDLLQHKIIDGIIEEPLGGAHRNQQESINNVKKAVLRELEYLNNLSPEVRKEQKREKFLKIGTV